MSRSNKDESAYQVTLDVAAFVRKQQNKGIADQSPLSAIGPKI